MKVKTGIGMVGPIQIILLFFSLKYLKFSNYGNTETLLNNLKLELRSTNCLLKFLKSYQFDL